MCTSASTASVEFPQPATLLIVEADAVFREFEARTLSDRGYTVLKASGMAEALELAVGSAAIHLLLAEFPNLRPDFSEHTQQFRTMHPAAPLLLVLEALEPFDQGNHNLGRIGIMAKPFSVDELITKVQRLLTETAAIPPPKSKAAKGQLQAVSPTAACVSGGRACMETATVVPEESRFLNKWERMPDGEK